VITAGTVLALEDGGMNNDNRNNALNLFSLHFIIAVSFFAVVVSGCSNGLKSYVRKDADLSTINKIAVLPLENFTSDKYASEKIRSIIMIDLLSRGLNVMEPGQVVAAMNELKVWSVSTMSIEDTRNIARLLDVEALIIGSVETFTLSRGISVSYPEVSIRFTLVESQDANTLWSVWHTAGGAGFWTRHFGVEGRTLDEAAKVVVSEAFDSLF